MRIKTQLLKLVKNITNTRRKAQKLQKRFIPNQLKILAQEVSMWHCEMDHISSFSLGKLPDVVQGVEELA